MKRSSISEYLSKIGRKGGKARLTKMSAERRIEVATKASKAAAKARTKKAQQRKAQNRIQNEPH